MPHQPTLGNSGAIGEAFHITNDEWLTWNQIYDLVAAAAGVEARKVHVASDLIAKHDPERAPGLLGDKMHSMIFDNSKIKRLVPTFLCEIPSPAAPRRSSPTSSPTPPGGWLISGKTPWKKGWPLFEYGVRALSEVERIYPRFSRRIHPPNTELFGVGFGVRGFIRAFPWRIHPPSPPRSRRTR